MTRLRLPGGNHPASDPRAGIASRLGLEIIGGGMDHHASADNASVTAGNGKRIGISSQPCNAGSIRQQLRQVAGMVFGMIRVPMGLTTGIEVPTGTGSIRCAAIAFLVHMEAVRAWRQAGNLGNDPGFSTDLGETHRPADTVSGRRVQLRLGSRAALPNRRTPTQQTH